MADELSLEERVELAEGQYKTIQDMYIRLAADFDNYKKRNSTISQDKYNDGVNDLATDILPVIDSLELAISQQADEAHREGLLLVKKSFVDIMAKYGVVEIEALGNKFDPKLHEAVMHQPDEANPGMVIKVLRTGYIRNGKVLRATMCVVS